MGIQEFKESLKENSANNNSGNSGSSGGYEEHPYLMLKPEVLICFDSISNSHMFMNLTDGDGNPVEDPCGGFGNGNLLLTLENPQVVSGTLFSAQGRDEGTIARKSDDMEYMDYLLCDSEAEGYDVDNFDSAGNFKGVKPNKRSNEYEGEPVDAFMEDTIDLQLSGRAALRVARTLDVNGRFPAGYHDGEFNNGFIENNPNDVSGEGVTYKRPTRFPQMRDVDWERHGGGFMVLMHASDINPDWSGHHITLAFNDFEGDSLEDATMIEPVHDPEAPEYDSKLFWTDISDGPDGGLVDDGDNDQDFPSDPLATEGTGSSNTFDIDSLPEQEQVFVTGIVENSEVYPGQDPVNDLLGGDWERWEQNVRKYYQGTQTVNREFCEQLNDECAAYANVLQLEQ